MNQSILQTVGTITFLSLLPTVVFFIIRNSVISGNRLFFLFIVTLLLFEFILFMTAQLGIRNHVIMNIYSLIYYCMSVTLLMNIWEKLKEVSKTLRIIRTLLVFIIVVGWTFENFVFANVNIYNPFGSTISSFFLVIICIYLINVMLFVKHNSFVKDSDGLILIGMLIRSFFIGLLMLFMNYRMKYSNDFYEKILLMVNFALIISNICFTLSVLCLPKKKKYTWPF